MVPYNESANIVLVCQQLDAIFRKKYMIIGAAIVACVTLYCTAMAILFTHENWFLFFFVLPMILHLLIEKYIDRLNKRIEKLVQVIKCNHEKNVLRNMHHVATNRSSEV